MVTSALWQASQANAPLYHKSGWLKSVITSANVAWQVFPLISLKENGCVSWYPAVTQAESSLRAVTAQVVWFQLEPLSPGLG